ncbi:unnamed protein product, partial [Darwinula stevensoni]
SNSENLISRDVVSHLEVVTKENKKKHLPVRDFAASEGLTVHPWPPDVAKGRFDVGVVVSFGHLIPESLIDVFPWGILNVHGSLLPKYRGAAPIPHTILNGDPITGVTIMAIRPHEFDVGDILLQEKCRVPEDATTLGLGSVLASLGADLLLRSLADLPFYMLHRVPQPTSGASKVIDEKRVQSTFVSGFAAPKPTASDAVLDWSAPVASIYRRFLAFHELFPLSTTWDDRPVKVLEMIPWRCPSGGEPPGGDPSAPPGTIRYLRKEKVLTVKCGDGWIRANRLAVQGHKPVGGPDFYNGYLSRRPRHLWTFRSQYKS